MGYVSFREGKWKENFEPLPEQEIAPENKLRNPKGNSSEPTIGFQGRTVSFREGMPNRNDVNLVEVVVSCPRHFKG